MSYPLIIAAIIFAVLFIIFLFAFFSSIRKKKFLGTLRNLTFSLLMLAIALLFALISISIQGYSNLTHEQLAATIEIESVKNKSFIARLTLPDNSISEFKIFGDEIYIDAHILKWKSIANLFGLHTVYELDRISGRYEELDEEISGERTVYSISGKKFLDIFELRQRYAFLSFLVDAEYGSATFIDVEQNNKLQVFVSTTGLLIRPVEEKP